MTGLKSQNQAGLAKFTPAPNALRVLFAIGIGTCLSLLGDASLYTVLPTETAAAGVVLANVGLLLSANRFVRLVLNGPLGMLYDRGPRRPLFLAAMFLGALSTALYALTQGLWPLLFARILWGLAWAGIWVGGNTILMDVIPQKQRGRWLGYYLVFFFLGSAGGFFLGGILTDQFGFNNAMLIQGALTLLGALVGLFLLPETRHAPYSGQLPQDPISSPANGTTEAPQKFLLGAATSLYAANRLVFSGLFSSTLGIFLLDRFGASISFGGRSFGVATLTGAALASSTLLSMLSTPLTGFLSDRMRNRWRAASLGLAPGVIGFALFTLGTPLSMILGIPCTAFTSSSNQNVATALVGDLSRGNRRGQQIGILFTFGDLASALGPLLAYSLLPIVSIKGMYVASAFLLGAMLMLTLSLSRQRADDPERQES